MKLGSVQQARRSRMARWTAALVLSAGVIAAACGGGSEGGGGTTATTQGGGPATTTPPPTTAAGEQPTPGGKLTMALEADTSNPWRPSEMLCAISCHQLIHNIYDTLTMPNADGGWSPYLAESVTANDDYTQWTITARADVTFHDGTPFDGAAIVENLERARTGITTGNVLRQVVSVEVSADDPMSAVVTVEQPWVAFPYHLSGQAGYMASPTWLKASDADPTLKTQPVGTGPFEYVSYTKDVSFVMKKNENYWNQPYPYLDEITFEPMADALSRMDALKSGTIDMLHTTNGQSLDEARTATDYNSTEISNNGETAYTLLHVTQEGSPLQDQRVRCALAYATDEAALLEAFGGGNQQASGPFSPTQVGYLEDTGYPMEQDMAKAQQLIAEYKAEHPGKLTLSLASTTDTTNAIIAQQQQTWWQEAGFDEVTVNQIDQASYILTAATGNFQTFQWRNHGGFDLDQQYYWWHSSSSLPVNQLALNFGRIRDTELDALLDENRGSTDPVRKKEIAEEVNRLFGRECYNLWGSYTIWGIMYKPTVSDPSSFTLPDGSTSVFGAGFSGTFPMMNLWIKQ